MLLRFGHEGQGKIRQKFASFRQVRPPRIQILLKCICTGPVYRRQSFQVGVDIVNAEIYVELELKSPPRVVAIAEVLVGMLEKLLSVSLVECQQDDGFVSFAAGGRLAELHPRPQIRPLVFECLVCAEVAQAL